MQILITSPIPTAPLSHGNRARVHSLCKALQQRGHIIHFVYTGFEGLDPQQELAMRQDWDHCYILDTAVQRTNPVFTKHHHIDAWYPPALDQLTQHILNKYKIDACVANYVWCSRWLTKVPRHIPRYIDTHDRFANRNERLRADGIKGDWFSTTPRQEAKALRRADYVFAIQQEEARDFENASPTPVEVVGHIMPEDFLATHDVAPSKPLKLGYLASNNPLNLEALTRFSESLSKLNSQHGLYELHIAGPISNTEAARIIPDSVRHGFVASPQDFYRSVDVILNPHIGGTGLKIKSVEALGYGKPLLATHWAMIGIESEHAFHQAQTIDEFNDHLIQLLTDHANGKQPLNQLAQISKDIFIRYQKQQTNVLNRLFPSSADDNGHGKTAKDQP